jgi:sterol desaturase/sphingolipid hydroxylase (fatty acid hydroxylase superfamily)
VFQALQSVYGHLPQDILHDGAMIVAFAVMGVGFYLLFEPGRVLSLRAALGHVSRRDLFRARTSRVDILHFVLMTALWTPITSALVTFYLTLHFDGALVAWFGKRPALLADGWWLATLQFTVLLVAREFGSYVAHRLLHRVPLLWSIHRSHHSAEVLTFLTSARAHPLEFAHMQVFIAGFGAVGGGLSLYLTGTSLQAAPVIVLVASTIFFEGFALAQHSHLPMSFGRLNRLFTAPVIHQLHHSAELRHRDRNFAVQLSLFDWLFGTLYLPQGREDYRLGLNDHELGDANPHLRLRDLSGTFAPCLAAAHL